MLFELNSSAPGKRFGTVLADAQWQFQNRTGLPQHRRLARFGAQSSTSGSGPR